MTELIGVAGGFLFLLGFIEVSIGKWDGTSFRYEICNLFGALFLGYYGYQKQAYTNIVLNIVWGTIALYAIYHSVNRHKIRKRKIQTKRSVR